MLPLVIPMTTAPMVTSGINEAEEAAMLEKGQ